MRSQLNKFGLTTKISVALAAAVLLGVASVAQASDHENEGTRAFHIGPLGQYLGGPAFGGGHASGSARYVPGSHRVWRGHRYR
jgi:hypothetical protein